MLCKKKILFTVHRSMVSEADIHVEYDISRDEGEMTGQAQPAHPHHVLHTSVCVKAHRALRGTY